MKKPWMWKDWKDNRDIGKMDGLRWWSRIPRFGDLISGKTSTGLKFKDAQIQEIGGGTIGIGIGEGRFCFPENAAFEEGWCHGFIIHHKLSKRMEYPDEPGPPLSSSRINEFNSTTVINIARGTWMP